MPITAAVHAILFEGLDVGDAVTALMTRDPRLERDHPERDDPARGGLLDGTEA